jgi:hypothetical protein
MRCGIRSFAALLAVPALLLARETGAANPNVAVPADASTAPAVRYAGMTGPECLAELARRKIAFTPAAETPGVDAPVRLASALHGVAFKPIHYAPEEAMTADATVVDCRLALALDDFGEKLAARGVSQIGYISAYRRDPTGKVKAGQRHPAGLAMDVAWIRKGDGATLNVLDDFHGRVGSRTCGPRAAPPSPATEAARQLREILCEAASERLFNVLLTPNYDRAHHNHVHLEVRRNIGWFLVQ